MERQLRIQTILTSPARHDINPVQRAVETFHRSTNPDAPMQMLLRFTTEDGPRTIIASGVPLRVASAITLEMMRAAISRNIPTTVRGWPWRSGPGGRKTRRA